MLCHNPFILKQLKLAKGYREDGTLNPNFNPNRQA
jgi:hypothetical protein